MGSTGEPLPANAELLGTCWDADLADLAAVLAELAPNVAALVADAAAPAAELAPTLAAFVAASVAEVAASVAAEAVLVSDDPALAAADVAVELTVEFAAVAAPLATEALGA